MKVGSLLLVLLFASCAIFKGDKKKNLTIRGKIEVHKPYCGGAKPTPEMEKGFLEAYANAKFYVKTSMNNEKNKETILTFTTTESGTYNIKLKKGTYLIIPEDKTMSFEDYKNKYSQPSDKFLQYIGDEAARKIYETADFTLTVEKEGEHNFIHKTKCFAGMNPLVKYVGPSPQ